MLYVVTNNSSHLQCNSNTSNTSGTFTWNTIQTASKSLTSKNIASEKQELVRIFPNPAQDFIHISLTEHLAEKISIFIYDEKGAIVMHQTSIENNFTLDTSPLSGLYIIKITSSTLNHLQKLIIN